MTLLLDTNVIVRHLTGEPAAQAARATRFLAEAPALILPDLVVAELIYVLESVYAVERQRVAQLVRAVIAFPTLQVADEAVLLRALELYEGYRLDFAEAYLVALAEATGAQGVASFDRAIDRVPTARRVEP